MYQYVQLVVIVMPKLIIYWSEKINQIIKQYLSGAVIIIVAVV